MALLAVSMAVTACEEKPVEQVGEEPEQEEPGKEEEKDDPGLYKVDFRVNETFPLELGNLNAEGSSVGVTVKVTKVEDCNFVFELRPGAKVQSFKMKVYPLANLYNSLLNSRNSGKLTAGDPVSVNECIRSYLFAEEGGGYSFSVNDYSKAEDFLQIEFDWMNTQYAAESAVAIPDCGFVIAVVGSTKPDISSANQEELTLCYVHTSSQALIGDPQCEIKVSTGYRAFGVEHIPNTDAAGIYYFGGLASEIDEYIDAFGDTMFRDFMRTLYTSPVLSDNTDGLTYTKDYAEEADHTIKSATCAVAVDANLTPQAGFSRQDFSLEEMPDEEDQDLAEPVVVLLEDRIAAAYIEFDVKIPKTCNTIFYSFYTEEQKNTFEAGSSLDRKKEAIRLVKEGYGCHNPNFSFNEDAPEDQRYTGASATVRLDGLGADVFVPGTTIYVGITGRNGYGTPGPLIFSDPVKLDQRNLTSPDNCKVKNLKVWIDSVSRTAFKQNLTYDPNTVSMVYCSYMTKDNNPGLTEESSWSEWVNFIFDPGDQGAGYVNRNMNVWWRVPEGSDPYAWTGMKPGVEYTVFLCAEDFDGNVSRMYFTSVVTKEVQVGPDPTVNMTLGPGKEGWKVTYTIDHDVEYFKYCLTDNVDNLSIPGATQSSLNDIAASGISYEVWRDAIYEWTAELGMNTEYESVSQDFSVSKVHIAACLAAGRNEDGEPVYKLYHLICKDGKAQTLEEIFGIKE